MSSKLYFAYSAMLDPAKIASIAPKAEFRFTAHYPETRLVFINGPGSAPLPTLVSETGHTVWGAVFELTDRDFSSVHREETSSGLTPAWPARAVDREGNKHECVTYVSPVSDPHISPDPEYVKTMIRGARHWSLPAGWVMGLEDLTEDSYF